MSIKRSTRTDGFIKRLYIGPFELKSFENSRLTSFPLSLPPRKDWLGSPDPADDAGPRQVVITDLHRDGLEGRGVSDHPLPVLRRQNLLMLNERLDPCQH